MRKTKDLHRHTNSTAASFASYSKKRKIGKLPIKIPKSLRELSILDGFNFQLMWSHETKVHETRAEPYQSQQNKAEADLAEGKMEIDSKMEADAEASNIAPKVPPASFAEKESVEEHFRGSRTPHTKDEAERDWGSSFCFT